MQKKILPFLFLLFLSLEATISYAQTKHVILISIDGFHPDMYLDKAWPSPNLRELMKRGTYADHLLSVFPAYTYPSHTAMLTGALPARSGIVANQPKGSRGEWNWYNSEIKVPTLWQAMKKAGITTAAVEWPVTVGTDVSWNLPEIWDVSHEDDRISVARKYATPGLVEEIEQNATGKLDSTNFNDNYFSWDENIGRIAAYIFKSKKPTFMAVHFANVDGQEHEDGRDADSVRMALATDDHAIGDILLAVEQSGEKNNTTVVVVGDHGFATINQIMRPNMLIKGIPAKFTPAGGSCFLYPYPGTSKDEYAGIVKSVTDSLDKLPLARRKLFRIINRPELDKMGADSAAIMALTAQPGLVFSGSTSAARTVNHGPGTLIQQNKLEGLFIPTTGGHHGYDPNIPEMYTGFIAAGPRINKGGHIRELRETDIAVLIARLLNIDFQTPDGRNIPGVISTQ